MAKKRRGKSDETEMCLLGDESFTDEGGPSTGSNEKLRLMVLGGDDALLDKACATILGERQNRDAFKFGELKPRTDHICGRQVSVLKTPSYWLEHLKSFWVFSNGVKAIRDDMESYESQLFPGPHAFLLVHRDVKNSGRENYLLRALSEVFGKKVLDYCMVLFIDQARHNNPRKNYCLKMCGGRSHILHNSDYSVNELFMKIESMTESEDSFFTTHLECFRKASNYFQVEYEEKENKLRKELNDLRERESQLSEELKDLKEKENQLSKELKDSKEKENQVMEEFCTSIHRERQLNEELIIYKDRESQLKDDKQKLQRKVEQLNEKEKHLQNKMTEAKVKEAFLLTRLQSEGNMIQREEEAQAKENELNEKERELDRRVKELEIRERNLDKRQKELEIREREETQRDVRSREHLQTTADPPPAEREGELKSRDDSQTRESPGEGQRWKPVRRNSIQLEPPDMSREHHQTTEDPPPAVSRDKSRPLDEREGELKSRDDSQTSGSLGIQKPERRDSKDLEQPNMSDSEHRPLHAL